VSIEIRDRLIAQRLVPVLRLPSEPLAELALECLADAGFTAIEIALTTPGAVPLIARHAERLLIGAGTVLDLEAAHRCLDAGARFIVSPCLAPGVAPEAHIAGAAALVGAYTPSEILAAHREGADIVKLFPASSGGPAHLRAVRAVFPQILFCPTGGVSLDNMRAYLEAGAALVGVGSEILDLRALEAGDTARVIAHARRFRE
jgi:2-dehydro-3-deoxyphosphogluconate aldolase/(4S)-4-hydroxy-2-oxoglutarate aldolase